MKTTIYAYLFIRKNVQVTKAIAQSSFPNPKNVDVEPLRKTNNVWLYVTCT